MSGLVGILNGGGEPIDRALLQQMTDFMAFRGPDALDIWSAGHVGFGHALLRTTWESEKERQPLGLNGEVWIASDVRLNRRDQLMDLLRLRNRVSESRVRVGGKGCRRNPVSGFLGGLSGG